MHKLADETWCKCDGPQYHPKRSAEYDRRHAEIFEYYSKLLRKTRSQDKAYDISRAYDRAMASLNEEMMVSE